jgi:hypothetical protein
MTSRMDVRGRAAGRALAIVASLALLAGGCSFERREPPTSKPTGPAPSVEFTASIHFRATAIDISYRLVNRDDQALYVLNRLFEGDFADAFVSQPDHVYVTVRPRGGVEIAKRAFDPPPGPDYDAPAILGGSRLIPGRSAEESFSVPLPLTRHHPYGNHPEFGPTTLPDPIRYVVFCLGVVDMPPEDDPARLQNLVYTHTPYTTQAQHVFCSAEVRLA